MARLEGLRMRDAIAGVAVGLSFGAGLVAGAVLLAAPGALAGSTQGGWGKVGVERETLKWKTQKGSMDTENLQRTIYYVPEYYGQLKALGAKDMWFVDDAGVLRNVILPNPEVSELVQITRKN
jgi:hypothetical protein